MDDFPEGDFQYGYTNENLDMELFCNFKLKMDLDRLSAATLKGGVWVDSTSYRENFDFVASTPKPGARPAYTNGSVAQFVDFQTSFYSEEREDGTYRFRRRV